MRTAEQIITEYLERGYSIESLRVLAESRSEPLCSEMLAILARMQEQDAPEVACETAPAYAGGGLDDMVFFVAADEESASGEDNIDFDLMAETAAPAAGDESPPAFLDESVAEILIGETEGSDLVGLEAVPAAEIDESPTGDVDGPGIWSRRWSEQNTDPDTRTESDPVIETAEAEEVLEPAGVVEDAVSTPQPEIVTEEQPAAEAREDVVEEATESETATLAEASDYLPGSVAVPHEETGVVEEEKMNASKRLLLEAHAALSERASAEVESVSNGGDEPACPVLFNHAPPTAPVPPESTEKSEKKTSRRERRRKERAEKKKQKARNKKGGLGTNEELPEIILTRSDGTDTLVPENGEAPSDAGSMPALAEPVASSAPPPAEAVAEEAAAAEEGEPAVALTDDSRALPAPSESLTMLGDECVTDAGAMLLPATPGQLAAMEENAADAAEAEAASEAEAGDHLMIVAGGGVDLRADAYGLLADETADGEVGETEPEADFAAEGENNIILFRTHYPEFDADGDETEDERPMLRMLPPVDMEPSDGTETAEEEPAALAVSENDAAGDRLSLMARLGLLRAVSGLPVIEECLDGDDSIPLDNEHVIVGIEDEEEGEAPGLDAAARQEIEQEYQERLDEFARRLLEVQGSVAEGEARIREKKAEIETREAEIAALKTLMGDGERQRGELAEELSEAKRRNEEHLAELDKFNELRDEHERLYGEFEDLRKAYNEVVTDVMPNLQGERDDLALTVERQCAESDQLRSTLGSARRRLAVGYSLGAAACIMMIALPIANWLRSGDDNRELAIGHQKATEIRERLEKAEQRNVEAEKAIFDLERKNNMAKMELAKLEEKTGDLMRIVEQRNRELASVRASSGTPTRASTMALQGPAQPDGSLRRNEVRDPAGSIDEVVAHNRVRYRQDDANLASGNGQRIPVSAVASSPALRPPAAGQQQGRGTAAPTNVAVTRPVSHQGPRPGEITAKVKAGEGVAQVVYRALGTRDPEVINWVIRENNIQKDRRGNPRIYPDQELRLPQGGRMTQAASAAGR